MIRLGLIGYPLTHSFSRRYFTEKFEREGIPDACYELFPLPGIARLPDLLAQNPDLLGLNVTIPHKVTVIPFLDALDATAQAVGAVNTIRIRNGRLTGFNTDAPGFRTSLENIDGGRWARAEPGKQALILGAGGAARAVAYVLGQLGIPFRLVSRQPAEGSGQLSYTGLRALDFGKIRWIFNASPVGAFPEVSVCPDLPYERLHAAQLVYDLVYNPAETLLLQRAKAQGATTANGLEMLHLQAEAAWAIWRSA
ncbi:MAG: shikimate dehydrogenase [Saprospiraceae bacterium]|nr:shikimate dehydrogenase [Saprospiraceae bacterium]